MEDYAIYLTNAARSDVAALHQYMILYDQNCISYHIFFEGEDDSLYYMPEVRRRLDGRNVHIYDCGGKKNVIEVRDAIKSKGYDVDFCLFFVDRDYDDYLGTQVCIDSHTYITDYYSIENDISTAQVASIIVEDVIHISKADPEFAIISKTLPPAFSIFYREILPLVAWILAAKEENLSPNLRNTNGLRGIINISGMLPSRTRKGFAEFKRKVAVNGQAPQFLAVLKWRRCLDIASAKLWVRGKYDAWFFQNVLLEALSDINKLRRDAGKKPVIIPRALHEGKLFELLGGRVPVPDSLVKFLDKKFH